MKQDLKSMTLAEMQEAFVALGEPKFRAKQVFTWLHRGATCFDEMTNLPKTLREQLAQPFSVLADVSGMVYLAARTRGRYRLVKSRAACVCRQRGSRNRLAGLNDAVKLVDIIYIT